VRPALALGLASVMAGLSESGILAILAQCAAAIVAGTSRVRVDLGPWHTRHTLTALLVAALVLALVRLALQSVLAAIPARVAAEVQRVIFRR
jgi:hypothetical protein